MVFSHVVLPVHLLGVEQNLQLCEYPRLFLHTHSYYHHAHFAEKPFQHLLITLYTNVTV